MMNTMRMNRTDVSNNEAHTQYPQHTRGVVETHLCPLLALPFPFVVAGKREQNGGRIGAAAPGFQVCYRCIDANIISFMFSLIKVACVSVLLAVLCILM